MLGTTIAHYKITAKLGQGGMGEVYRATDTKLDRNVAIKVLPESFAQDKERLARFEREAKTLATLNHPNIAGIFGLEKSGPSQALILELVEGEDLSEQLKRGPLPVDEALEVCKQIAEALEAAHEKGIIHRDLKPGNVKTTKDAGVKVLDFGLAKVMADDSITSTTDIPDDSPTITDAFTQPGTILGTAAYMSPEQARGKHLDKRSDIWSFGCVLFESLSGRKAFQGEDVTDTLAAIIKGDPNWEWLPENVPPSVRWLLKKCLTKDYRHRLQDIADARIELEHAMRGEDFEYFAHGSKPKFSFKLGIAAMVVAAFIGIAFDRMLRDRNPEDTTLDKGGVSPIIQSVIPIPESVTLPALAQLVFSPDGQWMAMSVVRSQDDTIKHELFNVAICLIPLRGGEHQLIQGQRVAMAPFFSADSNSIGYCDVDGVFSQAINGSARKKLADAAGPFGASWAGTSNIVISDNTGGMLTLHSASSGKVDITNNLGNGPADMGRFVLPTVVEEYNYVLCTRGGPNFNTQSILTVDLLSGAEQTLIEDAAYPLLYQSQYLFYASQGNLYAQAFDPASKSLIGARKIVVSELAKGSSQNSESVRHIPSYAIAQNQLAYLVRADITNKIKSIASFVWLDRSGNISSNATKASNVLLDRFELSPDGSRIAAIAWDGDGQSIFLYDLAQGMPNRMYDSGNPFGGLAWSTDHNGKEWVYFSRLSTTLKPSVYRTTPNSLNPAELVYESSATSVFVDSIPSDGRGLALVEVHDATGYDITFLPLQGNTQAQPRDLVRLEGHDGSPSFSPDSKWIAYSSETTGERRIYAAPMSDTSIRYPVSTQVGRHPVWHPSKPCIYYEDGNAIYEVEFEITDNRFVNLSEKQLFTSTDPRLNLSWFRLSKDGERFLVRYKPQVSEPLQYTPENNGTIKLITGLDTLLAELFPTATE